MPYLDLLRTLRERYPDAQITGGNVATREGVKVLGGVASLGAAISRQAAPKLTTQPSPPALDSGLWTKD
jgi:hypothetical protein